MQYIFLICGAIVFHPIPGETYYSPKNTVLKRDFFKRTFIKTTKQLQSSTDVYHLFLVALPPRCSLSRPCFWPRPCLLWLAVALLTSASPDAENRVVWPRLWLNRVVSKSLLLSVHLFGNKVREVHQRWLVTYLGDNRLAQTDSLTGICYLTAILTLNYICAAEIRLYG